MTLDLNNITYDAVCEHAARTPMYRQATRFYSIAEHCVLLSLEVQKSVRYLPLLTEADALTAARLALLPVSAEVELYFGLADISESIRYLVNHTAERLLADEMYELNLRGGRGWIVPCEVSIAGMPWQHAAAAFSQRFAELWPEWDDEARAEVWRAEVRALRAS